MCPCGPERVKRIINFNTCFSFTLFLKTNVIGGKWNRCEKNDSSIEKILFFKSCCFVRLYPISLDNGDFIVISLNSTEVSYWPCDDKAVLLKQQNVRRVDDIHCGRGHVRERKTRVWGIGRWGDLGGWGRVRGGGPRSCPVGETAWTRDYDGDVVSTSSPVESSPPSFRNSKQKIHLGPSISPGD